MNDLNELSNILGEESGREDQQRHRIEHNRFNQNNQLNQQNELEGFSTLDHIENIFDEKTYQKDGGFDGKLKREEYSSREYSLSCYSKKYNCLFNWEQEEKVLNYTSLHWIHSDNIPSKINFNEELFLSTNIYRKELIISQISLNIDGDTMIMVGRRSYETMNNDKPNNYLAVFKIQPVDEREIQIKEYTSSGLKKKIGKEFFHEIDLKIPIMKKYDDSDVDIEIQEVRWHPYSNQHLVVLLQSRHFYSKIKVRNFFYIFRLSKNNSLESPEKDFTPILEESIELPLPNEDYVNKAVSFCFGGYNTTDIANYNTMCQGYVSEGNKYLDIKKKKTTKNLDFNGWAKYSVYVLFSTGSIGVLCPIIPSYCESFTAYEIFELMSAIKIKKLPGDNQKKYNLQYNYLVRRFGDLVTAVNKYRNSEGSLSNDLTLRKILQNTFITSRPLDDKDTDLSIHYPHFQWLKVNNGGITFDELEANKIEFLCSPAFPFDEVEENKENICYCYLYIGYSNGDFQIFLNLEIPDPDFINVNDGSKKDSKKLILYSKRETDLEDITREKLNIHSIVRDCNENGLYYLLLSNNIFQYDLIKFQKLTSLFNNYENQDCITIGFCLINDNRYGSHIFLRLWTESGDFCKVLSIDNITTGANEVVQAQLFQSKDKKKEDYDIDEDDHFTKILKKISEYNDNDNDMITPIKIVSDEYKKEFCNIYEGALTVFIQWFFVSLPPVSNIDEQIAKLNKEVGKNLFEMVELISSKILTTYETYQDKLTININWKEIHEELKRMNNTINKTKQSVYEKAVHDLPLEITNNEIEEYKKLQTLRRHIIQLKNQVNDINSFIDENPHFYLTPKHTHATSSVHPKVNSGYKYGEKSYTLEPYIYSIDDEDEDVISYVKTCYYTCKGNLKKLKDDIAKYGYGDFIE